ncbi:MAG: hypothetical protein [Betatorquevirus homini38]|uniref:Hepatitis TT virus Orf2/Gyrovirus Vp2 N-terminal domain-containing protein n=1 Tax=Anelloviridae sp. TaxID=2055263 RepID=A0A385E235_9VIRU|nr:MAG: hypothetical protein QKC63_gp3 [Anelloviridae sp.]AXQ65800.1 MAG: hypothetical protein [Anelloviridae sp.]
MSKFQKPTLYNGRGLDNQWMNNIFQSHDLFCGCNKVIEHLLDILKIQKCHHTTEEDTTVQTSGTGKEDEMPFDAEDLENLFAENTDAEG